MRLLAEVGLDPARALPIAPVSGDVFGGIETAFPEFFRASRANGVRITKSLSRPEAACEISVLVPEEVDPPHPPW